MSKIVSMSSGAIDPIARTKRVFWRPDTDATVLKVGQPVCYASDCITDHKERTADPTHLGLRKDSYAEGKQEFTGRLFIVEEPLTANVNAYAGICKSLGPKAGADGDMIEIFVDTPGAIVPVWTNLNCLLDQTIMGIRNGEADVSHTVRNTSKNIGVAVEDKDRSGNDGMVWMRMGGFFYDNPNEPLSIDDAANGEQVVVNYINVKSLQTSGSFSALKIQAESAAGASTVSQRGMALKAVAIVSASVANIVIGTTIEMEITGGTVGEYATPLQVKLYESGATLSSMGGKLSVLNLCVQVAQAPTANSFGWIYLEHHGAEAPDFLLMSDSAAAVPIAGASDTTTTHKIPCRFGGVTYYICCANVA